MAALTGGRYHTFAALLTGPQVRDRYEQKEAPLVSTVYPLKVFEGGVEKRLPGVGNHDTP